MNSKSHNPMKLFFLFFLTGFLPLFLFAQEDEAILDQISGKLEAYRQHCPLEKLFLQTDKDVYAPGEIVWFSGVVLDRSDNRLSLFSREITVALYSADGKQVTGDIFEISGGKITGDLLLPSELVLGRYYLAAYTLRQDTPDNLFLRELSVDKFYESDVRVAFTSPGKVYQAGTKEDIELVVTDLKGNPADKFQMNYEVCQKDRKLAEGKVRSQLGIAVIHAELPIQTGSDPVEVKVSHPKNLWTRKLALRTSADKIRMQFYVEGGNLLGNVPQKTGFYATTFQGVPVDLEADITDGTGQVVSKTKTFTTGFGMFPYKAKPSEKCRLIITSEYGRGQSFELPGAGESNGVALVVSKTDRYFVTADILVADPQPKMMALTATRGYRLLWSAQTKVTGNSRIRIPVTNLESGVVLLSLFDEKGEMVSSRLVNISGQESMDLQIAAMIPESGKVRITLKATDESGEPLPARIILSVADSIRKTVTGHISQETVNLNGELKNPCTDVGSLVMKADSKAVAWDYLLICNESLSFSWPKIVNSMNVNRGDTVRLLTGISGKVTDKKGNPVPGARISIMNNRDRQIYTATACETGTFRVPSLQPVDIRDLGFTVVDGERKGSQVVLDPVFSEIVGQKVRQTDFFRSARELPLRNVAGYLALNPLLVSGQPVIKPVSNGRERPRSEPYKTMLQSATSLIDVIRSMKPFTLMNGQIVFYGTINSINAQSGALIVIDGQKMGTQIDALNNISPYDVEKINISLDPMDIQRYTGLNNVGIIEITTKRGGSDMTAGAVTQPEEQLYRDGYRIPRNFLTTEALQGESGKDLRTTLYWNPGLETGPSGTTTFSIPLSDIKSGFIISATAITREGRIVEAQQRFDVR